MEGTTQQHFLGKKVTFVSTGDGVDAITHSRTNKVTLVFIVTSFLGQNTLLYKQGDMVSIGNGGDNITHSRTNKVTGTTSTQYPPPPGTKQVAVIFLEQKIELFLSKTKMLVQAK